MIFNILFKVRVWEKKTQNAATMAPRQHDFLSQNKRVDGNCGVGSEIVAPTDFTIV